MPIATVAVDPMPSSLAVEKYLEEMRLLRKPMTVVSAQQVLEEYLAFADPSDIRAGVLRWLSWCKSKGNSTRTLEAKRMRVQCFYKRLDINLKIPRIRFTPPRPETYSQQELDALFRVAKGRRYWLYKAFLQSGLRKQEMQHLEYSNLLDTGLQVAAHRCHCHGTWTPKDHEERVVRVPRALIENLRALPRVAGELIFPSRTGLCDAKMLLNLKRLAKRAGLDPEKAGLHKFRACFASTLLHAGVDIRTLMGQMGHSKIESTMR